MDSNETTVQEKMPSEDILMDYKSGVRTIKLNRPQKKNAITQTMYKALTNILNVDAADDNIVVTIITGVGDYFSSGNDLKSAITELQDLSENGRLDAVDNMIKAFINYPKILIAVVNGPAIGIGSTILAVCDIVYATDRAVFDTPFVKLGLCAEGASSFTFPFTLGRSKASEVILLNHKLSAQEAYTFGFVSKVIPQNSLNQFIEELHKYGDLPVNSVKRSKKLITDNFQDILLESNEREMKMLEVCANSEEFSNAIMKFMSKSKSKL